MAKTPKFPPISKMRGCDMCGAPLCHRDSNKSRFFVEIARGLYTVCPKPKRCGMDLKKVLGY